MYKIVKFLLKFLSHQQRLLLSYEIIDDIVVGKEYSIGNTMAEKIITKVIK